MKDFYILFCLTLAWVEEESGCGTLATGSCRDGGHVLKPALSCPFLRGDQLMRSRFLARRLFVTNTLAPFSLPMRPALSIQQHVTLTATEEELFDSLVQTRNRAGLSHVEMRVVGGWCRDVRI